MRLPSAAPVRVPPLASRSSAWEAGRFIEPALGRMAFVCGLVAHSVAPLAVLG